MRWIALLGLLTATAVVLAVGCGGDDANGEPGGGQPGMAMPGSPDDAATNSTASASGGGGRLIKVVDSEYGRVIADAKGEAIYLFGKERSAKPKCLGECARAWPPLLTKGRPRAAEGVRAKLLGTTRRPNGKLQVTYRGDPLYYYVDDSPGIILCQDVSEFGGLWLVVKPSGAPVT